MTPSAFNIRDARESDLPDILAMIRELAAFENLEHELQVTAGSLHDGLFGLHHAAVALVALAGGEAVGYAIFYKTFSSFTGRSGLFLDDIYVRPAWRKKGIGRALLGRVAEVGVVVNSKRIEWIALRWNENALKFYEGVGARMLEDWVMLRMDPTGMKRLGNRNLEHALK